MERERMHGVSEEAGAAGSIAATGCSRSELHYGVHALQLQRRMQPADSAKEREGVRDSTTPRGLCPTAAVSRHATATWRLPV